MIIDKLTVIVIFVFCDFYIKAAEAVTRATFYGALLDLFNDGVGKSNKTMKTAEEMTLDELGISRHVCYYNFVNYVAYKDRHFCYTDDEYILHLLPSKTSSDLIVKPPISVKCLDKHPFIRKGGNRLRVMETTQEIVDLLKPIGNNTKRYEPGSCVLVYFYTLSCLSCTKAVISINNLAHTFQTLPIVAVNANKFTGFNIEFGIVAVPTLMLFHQGRPVVKYRQDASIALFVTRHTGIKPSNCSKCKKFKPPLPLKLEDQTDYILILAWFVIIVCGGYYFSGTELCKQIIEIIKRNWREAEEQQLEQLEQ